MESGLVFIKSWLWMLLLLDTNVILFSFQLKTMYHDSGLSWARPWQRSFSKRFSSTRLASITFVRLMTGWDISCDQSLVSTCRPSMPLLAMVTSIQRIHSIASQVLPCRDDPGKDGDPVIQGTFTAASQARRALLPASQRQYARLRSALPVSAWSAQGRNFRNLSEGWQVDQALAGAAAEEHWGDVQSSSRTAAAAAARWTAGSAAASTSKRLDAAPDLGVKGRDLPRCQICLNWVSKIFAGVRVNGEERARKEQMSEYEFSTSRTQAVAEHEFKSDGDNLLDTVLPNKLKQLN